MRKELAAVAAGLLLATPGAAFAQSTTVADAFVVGSVGYHDLGVDSEDAEEFGIDIDDGALIYGAVAGFDVPLSTNAFIGVEANYHFGSDAIDSDYGVTARLGYKSASGMKIYARGGYQWINVDPAGFIDDEDIEIPEGSFDGIDDTEGDYLVGAGVDVPFGNLMLRGTIDTVSFDTLRATVGVGVTF